MDVNYARLGCAVRSTGGKRAYLMRAALIRTRKFLPIISRRMYAGEMKIFDKALVPKEIEEWGVTNYEQVVLTV